MHDTLLNRAHNNENKHRTKNQEPRTKFHIIFIVISTNIDIEPVRVSIRKRTRIRTAFTQIYEYYLCCKTIFYRYIVIILSVSTLSHFEIPIHLFLCHTNESKNINLTTEPL